MHKLWVFSLLPGIICLALLVVTWIGISAGMDELRIAIGSGAIGISGIDFIIEMLLWIFHILGFIFFLIFIFPIIVRIVLIPFLGTLSESVEKALTGAPLPDPPHGFLKTLLLGLRISIKLAFIEIVILILIGIIPSFIGQIIVFAVGSYFLGTGFFDLVLERKMSSIDERESYFKNHKGVLAGQGAAVKLFGLIPGIGHVLGLIGAVAGAVEIYLVDTDVISGKIKS
jgi:uncharacterized protein involved in cysteine biosynthesis